MSLETTEAALYTDVWAQVPAYRDNSPGEQLVSMFLEMADLPSRHRWTALDAGCGTGRGAVALAQAGFDVTMCDLTSTGLETQAFPFVEACLWDDLRPKLPALFGGKFDVAYCCDVLEHIPQEFTMLVIRNLLSLVRHGVFFNISVKEDIYGVHVGQRLHQTVKPFTWWRDRLSELGEMVECRDLLVSGVYYVRPR